MPKILSQEDVINRFILKHKGKYTYPKVVYVNSYTKVCITCPTHGDFWQNPAQHQRGRGCPKCSIKTSLDTKKATIFHKCKNSKRKRIYNLENFIMYAEEKHENFYTYEKSIYIDSKTKICITCPIHGDFWQTPNGHMYGYGCPKCGRERIDVASLTRIRKFTNESIDEILRKENRQIQRLSSCGFKIGYLDWKCLVCGEPWRAKHYSVITDGTGCPVCKFSKGETKILNFLKSRGIKFVGQFTNEECKNPRTNTHLRFDFAVLDGDSNLFTLVEFDGIQHFKPIREWFHKRFTEEESIENLEYLKYKDGIKNDFCKEKGIPLLRIAYTKLNKIDDILIEFFNKLEFRF